MMHDDQYSSDLENPGETSISVDENHAHSHQTRLAQTQLPIPRFATQKHGTMSLEAVVIRAYNALPETVKSLPLSENDWQRN